MSARVVTPPPSGMHARPFEPGWLYVENGIEYDHVLRTREGSLLYVDTATGSGNQRGRAIIPYRDPRDYPLLFTLRDIAFSTVLRTYCGINEVDAALSLTTRATGFPTWAVLNDHILVCRRGDPVRVIGVDDGAEVFFEDVVARDRDLDPFTAAVTFDDDGPYLGAMPPAHLVTAWRSRAFFSDGRTMWWSNGFGDYEALPASNAALVGQGPFQLVGALSTLGDSLVVFRYASIIVGRGDPSNGGVNMPLVDTWSDGVGCRSPRSIVPIHGVLWFLAQTGEVCVFDGSSARSVTKPLQNYLRPQVALAFDPLNMPRPEANALPNAVAVWYQPSNSYVVMMEGRTPGVFDLGFAVNVEDTSKVTVLSGFDAQALAVKPGDEDSLLTFDRFGAVYIQDRGPLDTTTTEDPITYAHTYATGRPRFIALPQSLGLGQFDRTSQSRLRILLEHLYATGPTVRPVRDTLSLHGRYRAEVVAPNIVYADSAARPPGYLADATARGDDFLIGTTPVAPDGFVAARVGLPGFNPRNSTIEVTNDALADGETELASPELLRPPQVGLAAIEWEHYAAGDD